MTSGKSEAFTLHVNFTAADETTVLFGPSGSGKTTTLRLIAGVLTPDEGSIKVGERIFFDSERNLNLSVQRRRVGYVFQDYALFPHLTAEQNVAYGVRPGENGNNGQRKINKRERARELLSLLRVEHTAKRHPAQLSGGESQRVALARTLASEPTVMLLDEPLSAVDVKTREQLLMEIRDVQRSTNIPFLYVTHNPAEAIKIGAHVVLLDQGCVVRRGRPEAVLSVSGDRNEASDH
ncbi:MAG: ATP-binding cassette domain-containing protein [Pyrinomonadaceae bacterium]